MNTYFIYLHFKISKSNFVFSGKFRNYFFKILGDKLEIITVFKSKNDLDKLANFSDSQDEIAKSEGFGLLLDVIALSTKLLVSNQSDGFVYSSTSQLLSDFHNDKKSFDELNNELKKQKGYSCGLLGEWPIVIQEGASITLTSDSLDFYKYLLNHLISFTKYKNSHISLFNYWRKGLVLDELWFTDESFLNYYKIIDYFLEKHRKNNGLIKKLLALFLKRKLELSEEDVRKTIQTLNLSPDKENIKLIFEFREIRNNGDIAHPSIKKTQGGSAVVKRGNLYSFSNYDNLWWYWDLIEEITRLFLLRHANLLDVKLVPDGGLLSLRKS